MRGSEALRIARLTPYFPSQGKAMLSYALTTKQRLIDFLDLEGLSATQETLLERAIDSATEFIENYCDRRFKKTAYTAEMHHGNGSRKLVLDHFPVVSGETFTLYERQTDLNDDDFDDIDSSYYFVDNDTGVVTFVNGSFRKGVNRWKVAYTAGYDFDNTDTFASDVGLADLEYACWKLAGTFYEKRKGTLGIKSEKLDLYSVTYTKTVMEDEDLKAILDKYASEANNQEIYVGFKGD